MSANFDSDIEIVRVRIEKMNALLTVMHGALTEVLKCDVSVDGAIDMKAAAEVALCEVQRIALEN